MQSRHPVSVFPFFVLVFALSVPFWVLGFLYPIPLLPGLPISALGALIPAIAAVLLTYKKERRSGVVRLIRRSVDFKRLKNKSWLLVAFLINPVIAVLAYGVMRATGATLPAPTPWTPSILLMLVAFLFFGLGEEIGWSGYATDPLQSQWGTITAGLLLGAVGVIWHLIPLIQVNRSVEWIAWWSLGTIALRMITTWLYISSGKSVFVAALFHAMINLSWQLFPNNGSHYDPQVFGLITLACAILIYAAERFFSTAKLQPASATNYDES